MRNWLSYGLFRFIKGTVRVFYPKIQVVGGEKLPPRDAVLVGNHCQMNGPIVGELYVPGEPYIWCAGEMLRAKDVPAYAFRDFWSRKPAWTHPFYRLLSFLIAPLSVCVFNNARTIGVYHDTRILATFKNTVKKLQAGKNVVIFPEYDEPCNQILYRFRDKFIDIARLYYRQTGRELAFVPMYIAPKLKKLCLGEPVYFRGTEPMEAERERICRYLMETITAMAEALPEHRVVPYRNVPKKEYPTNLPREGDYEKTCG